MAIVHVIPTEQEVRQSEILKNVQKRYDKLKQVQGEIDKYEKKKSKYRA